MGFVFIFFVMVVVVLVIVTCLSYCMRANNERTSQATAETRPLRRNRVSDSIQLRNEYDDYWNSDRLPRLHDDSRRNNRTPDITSVTSVSKASHTFDEGHIGTSYPISSRTSRPLSSISRSPYPSESHSTTLTQDNNPLLIQTAIKTAPFAPTNISWNTNNPPPLYSEAMQVREELN